MPSLSISSTCVCPFWWIGNCLAVCFIVCSMVLFMSCLTNEVLPSLLEPVLNPVTYCELTKYAPDRGPKSTLQYHLTGLRPTKCWRFFSQSYVTCTRQLLDLNLGKVTRFGFVWPSLQNHTTRINLPKSKSCIQQKQVLTYLL